MNFVIPVLVGTFLTSSFIGLIGAIVSTLRGSNSREFDWFNPGDAAMLLAFLSFVAMIICMVIGSTE